MIARRLAMLAPGLLAAALALACAFARQPGPSPAASAAGDGETPCYRVQPLDERRRKIECANGDRFTIRLADDGKWYPENKVRAGLVPGHESPEAAGKALCACS